jgi:nucleotide-binding universal stress UspA family protein
MAKRILVPLDLTEDGEAVASIAASLARSSGGTIRLLHVAPIPQELRAEYGRVVVYAHQEMARVEAEGQHALEDVEARLDGVPVETVVRFGEPAQEILREAEAFGADLIALASSRPRLLRLRRGVAEQVVRASRLPVMLLHPGEVGAA